RIGFLPKISASRPATGIATAPPSRVAVTTQDVLLAEVSSSSGRSDWIGITSDCIIAAHKLENPSTSTTSSGCLTGESVGLVAAGFCCITILSFWVRLCILHTDQCRLHTG